MKSSIALLILTLSFQATAMFEGETVYDVLNPIVKLQKLKISPSFVGEKEICTGSVIASRYILTAAHCIKAAGEVLYKIGPTKMKTVKIKNFIQHPKYKLENKNENVSFVNHDIAIAEVENDLPIRPMRILDKEHEYIAEDINNSNYNETFIAEGSGVGNKTYHDPDRKKIEIINLDILGSKFDDSEGFKKLFMYSSSTDEENSYAYKEENRKFYLSKNADQAILTNPGAQLGDSGSPLYFIDSKTSERYIVGVCSVVKGSGQNTLYAIYTGVLTNHLDWVLEQVKE